MTFFEGKSQRRNADPKWVVCPRMRKRRRRWREKRCLSKQTDPNKRWWKEPRECDTGKTKISRNRRCIEWKHGAQTFLKSQNHRSKHCLGQWSMPILFLSPTHTYTHARLTLLYMCISFVSLFQNLRKQTLNAAISRLSTKTGRLSILGLPEKRAVNTTSNVNPFRPKDLR